DPLRRGGDARQTLVGERRERDGTGGSHSQKRASIQHQPLPNGPKTTPAPADLVQNTRAMRPYGLTALRLAVGAVFVAHGAQKLFGIWGGPGLARTATFFASLGLSPAYPLAVLVAGLEFAGGLLLILGGATLWVSLALAAEMAVATWKVH